MSIIVHVIRTSIMFILVIIIMRFMGKRQIGQLQPYELVIAMMISDLASIPLQDVRIPMFHGIVPIITLMLLQITISFFILKFKFLRNIICGKPCILIKHGKIIKKNLRKQMYNLDDLLESLRLQGTTDISSIMLAILENNGNISVALYPEKVPATKEDLNCKNIPQGIPIDIIIGGYVMKDNMEIFGITKKILLEEINKKGFHRVKDVFYCYIDEQGAFHVQ